MRSLIVPVVPANGKNEPVWVKGSIPKTPVPVPTGRKSIMVAVTATDPVVFRMPVIGTANDRLELTIRAPAQTAAVTRCLRVFKNNAITSDG